MYCTHCQRNLPEDQFSKGLILKKATQGKCKICAKRWHLKYYHGVTLEELTLLYAQQNGKCAICGEVMDLWAERSSPNKTNLDHNHTTGKRRKLLCGKCNRGLGCFNEKTDLLEKAINYLKEHD